MLEGWSNATVGEIVNIASGQVDPKDDAIADLVSVGPDNLTSGGGIDVSSLRTARELGQISGKYAFDRNAILYSKIRPNLNKAALPDFDGICSADMYPMWISDPQRTDRKFVYQLLTSERFVSAATSRSFRTGLPKINREDLESIELTLPPISEQRRIAQILQTWDEAVAATRSVILKRERQYTGLRERLIDWSATERQSLRKLVNGVSRQVAKPQEPYRALSIRSHGKGTFERLVSDTSSVAMEHLFVAKAGDLIVNITFAWEGAVALVPPEHDGGLVSHRFPTFEPRQARVNPRYLRHALRMPRFTYLLGVVSPGGAGRNRVLNKPDFLELEIPTPSLKNQGRVVQILDDAEKAIETERLSLDALQRQKRGLMQKLLTGEWRVKLDAVEEGAR